MPNPAADITAIFYEINLNRESAPRQSRYARKTKMLRKQKAASYYS